MPITYRRPEDDAALYTRQARDYKAQLDNLDGQIKILRDAAARDEYDSVPRLKLPPLLHLRAQLESKLRLARSNAGMDHREEHPALASGAIWRGSDY
jgi:hypothetical protein